MSRVPEQVRNITGILVKPLSSEDLNFIETGFCEAGEGSFIVSDMKSEGIN